MHPDPIPDVLVIHMERGQARGRNEKVVELSRIAELWGNEFFLRGIIKHRGSDSVSGHCKFYNFTFCTMYLKSCLAP